jgi:hypothetical protein
MFLARSEVQDCGVTAAHHGFSLGETAQLVRERALVECELGRAARSGRASHAPPQDFHCGVHVAVAALAKHPAHAVAQLPLAGDGTLREYLNDGP